MRGEAGVGGRDRIRLERSLRIAFWTMLALSWLVAVVYMWEAVTRIPSADRLESSTVLGAPTVRTFVAAVIFSGMELGLVLGALWPWKTEFFASRLGVTGLAVLTWFIMTTPMDVSRMDWVHRRWLAFLAVAILLALVALSAYRALRRVASRKGEAPRPTA